MLKENSNYYIVIILCSSSEASKPLPLWSDPVHVVQWSRLRIVFLTSFLSALFFPSLSLSLTSRLVKTLLYNFIRQEKCPPPATHIFEPKAESGLLYGLASGVASKRKNKHSYEQTHKHTPEDTTEHSTHCVVSSSEVVGNNNWLSKISAPLLGNIQLDLLTSGLYNLISATVMEDEPH